MKDRIDSERLPLSKANPATIDSDWLAGVRDSLDELYATHVIEAQTCSDHEGKEHHTLRAAEVKKQLDAVSQLVNSAANESNAP